MATEDKNGCLHDDKTGKFTKKDYTEMSVAELRTRQAKDRIPRKRAIRRGLGISK